MFRKILQAGTKGEGDIVDLTPEIRHAVRESGINDGLVHLFVQHSTAALTTIEYEGGVLTDLKGALSRIAPADIPYAHDRAWGDGNGRSHVKAAIVGPSLSVPIVKGELGCGTWQQIVLLELDTQPSRVRSIVCTILG
ncbi:MAG: secondary thiamine-phosphate synthase enzyme YjbQ [Methanomicrobiales archaeon]|jgi:secondary thiamine-phosphate synthase enzyme|nr:secondary thiamine-phosphate synthase enzyme YjbQ [Methanomicrobiales archaeon]